jgi:hypothetical protein
MGARGLAGMAQDKRILVADAAHFIGKARAKRLINQAWKRRFITLYGLPAGVRPGESEPVEIPFNEGGRVDCKKSRISVGRLCATHLSVTMKWSDVERLTQADVAVERLLREADAPAPRDESNPASAQEASKTQATLLPPILQTNRVGKLAQWLRFIYGAEKPGKTHTEMKADVHKVAGIKFGEFSDSMLKRAILLAWPPATA